MEDKLERKYEITLKESRGYFFVHLGFLKRELGIDIENSFDAREEYHDLHVKKAKLGSYAYKPNEQDGEVSLTLKFDEDLSKDLEEKALEFVNKLKYSAERLEGKASQANQTN